MSKANPLFLEILVPAIRSVGKAEMKILLSGLREHNSQDFYDNVLKSIHSNFILLKDIAAKTKTRFDDGIIGLVLEAVEESFESVPPVASS
jgi:hypothetical protein